MTAKLETKPETPTLKQRFWACYQSTGRCSKSFTAEGLITALNYAKVRYVAVDADSQHRTLSRRRPGEVKLFAATKTLDDFARMIQALPPVPVIVADFPAQATDFLLNSSR